MVLPVTPKVKGLEDPWEVILYREEKARGKRKRVGQWGDQGGRGLGVYEGEKGLEGRGSSNMFGALLTQALAAFIRSRVCPLVLNSFVSDCILVICTSTIHHFLALAAFIRSRVSPFDKCCQFRRWGGLLLFASPVLPIQFASISVCVVCTLWS